MPAAGKEKPPEEPKVKGDAGTGRWIYTRYFTEKVDIYTQAAALYSFFMRLAGIILFYFIFSWGLSGIYGYDDSNFILLYANQPQLPAFVFAAYSAASAAFHI